MAKVNYDSLEDRYIPPSEDFSTLYSIDYDRTTVPTTDPDRYLYVYEQAGQVIGVKQIIVKPGDHVQLTGLKKIHPLARALALSDPNLVITP